MAVSKLWNFGPQSLHHSPGGLPPFPTHLQLIGLYTYVSSTLHIILFWLLGYVWPSKQNLHQPCTSLYLNSWDRPWKQSLTLIKIALHHQYPSLLNCCCRSLRQNELRHHQLLKNVRSCGHWIHEVLTSRFSVATGEWSGPQIGQRLEFKLGIRPERPRSAKLTRCK
jgi:hypothetical protein